MSIDIEATPTEPIQLTDRDDFEEAVTGYDVVLVDFYADWCGPCQMMEPTIETLASETNAAVVKVDVERFQGLSSEYGVQGIPTLLVFEHGELAERLVGAQSEERLNDAVATHAA